MATFKVALPVANIFKFTVDGRATNERVKYDQQRYYDAIHATVDQRPYFELYEKAREFKIQAYTNFPAMWLELTNCDGEVYDTINGSMIKEYRNQHYYSSCKLISLDGKMFVFFMNEIIYSDDTWTTPTGSIGYSGKLPGIEAGVGDQVRFVMAGNEYISTITEVGWNPNLQAEGYILDFDVTLIDPVDGTVDIAYNAKPVDLFEVNGDLTSVTDGLAYVKLKFGLTLGGPALAAYTSEPLDVQVKHQDALPIKYRHNGEFTQADVWNFEYPPNWYSTLMVPANMYQLITAGELEADVNDTGVQRKTRAIPYRQLQLNVLNIPGWIMDKLLIIFSHDALLINEYFWEIENYGTFEGIQQVDLGTLSLNLRQKDDRTLYEAEFESSLTASFDPDDATITYIETIVNSVFSTNTGQIFYFINLPAWLTPFSPVFLDGHTVQLTASENDTGFERSVTLIAQSDAFGNTLQAMITITQGINDVTPPPEFLDVAFNLINFIVAGGTFSVPVSASSTWEIGATSGYAFTYTIISPTQLDITASANEGFSDRAGSVTLRLASNHAITKTINVTQAHAAIIETAIAGGGGVVPMDGGVVPVAVTTTDGTVQWQASIPNPYDADWLSVSSTIRTGSQSINVTAHHNPLGYSRSGMVIFTNVNNPSNTIGVTISQNAE